jgi:hypothetical protein
MNTIKLMLAAALLPVALGAASVVHAEEDGHRPPGPPRRPPPQAFEACAGKKVAEACEVSFREHKITGVCTALPDDAQQLFCRPEHPPGPPPGTPPPN